MKFFVSKKVVVLVWWLTAFLHPAAPAQAESGPPAEDYYLVQEKPIEDTRAFQTFVSAPQEPLARVHYLIGLLRETDKIFIRNGKKYDGEKAADWLKYKLKKHRDLVSDTSSFIDDVASFSMTTGENYLIVLPSGARIPIRPVFYNEIRRLEHILDEQGEISGDGSYFPPEK